MKSVRSPILKVATKASTGIVGFDEITNRGLPHGRTTLLVGGASVLSLRVRLDAEEAKLEVRMKSLQTELLAKQVEKELLVRTTESRKREISQGLTRMELLRGADATKPDRK